MVLPTPPPSALFLLTSTTGHDRSNLKRKTSLRCKTLPPSRRFLLILLPGTSERFSPQPSTFRVCYLFSSKPFHQYGLMRRRWCGWVFFFSRLMERGQGPAPLPVSLTSVPWHVKSTRPRSDPSFCYFVTSPPQLDIVGV